MDAKEIFLSNMAILFIFDTAFVLSKPPGAASDLVGHMAYGGIVGLILTAAGIAVVAGITVAGSGLNSETIRIAFGVATLVNILFSKNFWGVDVGLGLAMPLFDVFTSSEVMGFMAFFGWILASGIVLMAMVSGFLIIAE
jgi:hypothetical protein